MTQRLWYLIPVSIWLVLLLFAAPAEACGCGAYIPREGEGTVVQERALVRWDGQTEDIVMALGVQGNTTEAAWIMPVPVEATVQLGQAELFDTLQELTKPRVEYRYGLIPPVALGAGAAPDGAVGGAAPVTLLRQQTLGPFEVSTLAATDATALSDWLADNGYTFPDGLDEVLQAYVEQKWFYIAARLTSGANGQELSGELDPLWITFPSDELIYPMRATALATGVMPVYLYVLSDHRVEKAQTFGDSRVAFAGWIEPAALPAESPLAPFVDRKLFLTKFEERIWNPPSVNDDYRFSPAAADEIYYDVEIEYRYDIGGVPIILLVMGGACLVGLVIIVGGTVLLLSRQRRRTATA
ncbi:MAG: DUF2330 domain-containing protein [Anaerolineae bacterium]|nr:DUF2330 domain-containing protein [Anaerolineales bacterium]MCQ3974776.1 DUF2330 domain-containing protein [Anaerolineae bacterium]